MQKMGLVHDTAVARRRVVAGEGSWVTDQVEPFHCATTAVTPSVPEVSLAVSPTAVQEDGLVHDTEVKTDRPVVGGVTIDQVWPFHCSTSGASSVVRDVAAVVSVTVLVVVDDCPPTARQNVADGQETEERSLSGLAVGTGTAVAVQVPPWNTAAIGRTALLVVSDPTATQSVAAPQETLPNVAVPPPPNVGVGTVDHGLGVTTSADEPRLDGRRTNPPSRRRLRKEPCSPSAANRWRSCPATGRPAVVAAPAPASKAIGPIPAMVRTAVVPIARNRSFILPLLHYASRGRRGCRRHRS
jgi:hypothetical protein